MGNDQSRVGANPPPQVNQRQRGNQRAQQVRQGRAVGPQGVQPYNAEERVNQEISNISSGIVGAGNPVNPEAADIARNIQLNNQKFGLKRATYFNDFRRKNKKAKSVKLVNLACMDEKWKAYKSIDWGYDIPVAPVNAALKSCVYNYNPNKPGKYDQYVNMNPPVQTPAPGPAPAPQAQEMIQVNAQNLPAQENIQIARQIDTGIPVTEQTLIQAPVQSQASQAPQGAPLLLDQPMNIAPANPQNPIMVQIAPEETRTVFIESEPMPMTDNANNAIVERFMLGVDSNNQNMRYLMWITIILLIIIIIGFYYKSRQEKLIVKA